MTVQRYDYNGIVMTEFPDGDYVLYDDYRSLVENYEAMCQQAKAAWQEHFLLSRENDRLKEKIREAGLGVVYQD